jgi:hypothetical protein
MTEPLNSAQITERARNVAQVILGFVSTDTDGGETIHSDDLALALRECVGSGLLPGGADGVLVWETARSLIPASVAVEGLSPEDHPAVRRGAEPTFAGEDFPEPADGEGARVAREEAAWEAQIKAAPLPAPVAPAPTAWGARAPVGSVWRFADDGLHAPAGAMGLAALSSNPHGIFGVVCEHVAIAAYGEPFVTADCVLLAFPSGPGVVMTVSALLWAAKRVDA